MRYEDLFGNELDFCHRLAEFTGLPLLDTELKPFSFYQRYWPTVARSGRIDEWRGGLSPAQFELLRERYADQMARLGYSMPESA